MNRRPLPRLFALILLAAALPALVPTTAWAGVDYKDWILGKTFPPVTDAQKALKDVPFAAGSPAVVPAPSSARRPSAA
jgi:hypothetical protein